jgi:oxaloacetate decarboxylase gamma subunit
MEMNQLVESVKFMIIGMGTVYLFLLILVLYLHFQAYIINKYFPQEPSLAVADKKSVKSSVGVTEDSDLVAAITIAIQKYKQNKG